VWLELSFSTKEVRRICKNKNSAVKKLGSEFARFLHDRLADIDAVDDGSELKLLSGLFQLDDQLGTVTSSLKASIVLKAEAGPTSVVRSSSGQIDWQEVVRLKVVEVRGVE
jgi:hypothetical protein